MRSRDGDRPLTLTILTLIFLPYLWADEYIISYRAVVRDAIMVSETLNVSRAMQKCEGRHTTSVLLETGGSDDLHQIIVHDHDTFFSLMQQTTLHIDHREKNIDATNQSHTILTMPPQCFTVDINQDLAKITALK